MPFKTFEWFKDQKRPPSEYEEISVHNQWHAPYHMNNAYGIGLWRPEETRWRCGDWDKHRDPAKLTYKTYNEIQHEKERDLDSVLDSARRARAFERFDPAWVSILRQIVPAQRYAEWGVSMCQQYVGRQALASPISSCAMFQIMDELRHAQRWVELALDLDRAHGGFDQARAQWMTAEPFQPLREYLERVLTLRDWAEVVVASNLVLEPMLQPILLGGLGELAQANGDTVLPYFTYSLNSDEERHTAWARALAKLVQADTPDNVAVTQEWVDRWYPLADRAVRAFAEIFDQAPRRPIAFAALYERIVSQDHAALLADLGLKQPTAAPV